MFFVISGWARPCRALVDRVGARPSCSLRCRALPPLGWWRALAQGYGGWWWLPPRRAGQRTVPPGGLHHPEQARVPSGWGTALRCTASAATWAGPRRRCSWRALPRPRVHGAPPACAARLLALLVLAIMVINRDALDDRQGAGPTRPRAPPVRRQPSPSIPWPSLKLPSVWLCFSFFFWSTCALSAIQALPAPHCSPCTACPLSLNGHGGHRLHAVRRGRRWPGGFLVGRVQQLEQVISVCLLGSLPRCWRWWAGAVAWHRRPGGGLIAGLGTGLAGPSRDMLIKRAARPAPQAVPWHRVLGPGPGLLPGGPRVRRPCWTGA